MPPPRSSKSAVLLQQANAGVGGEYAYPTRSVPRNGSTSRLREMVASSRVELSDEIDDEQKNMAYLARTATENILALEKVVNEQEMQLEERKKEIATLQRNYETLSRIRQGDSKELAMLRAQRQQEGDEMARLRELLGQERAEKTALEAKLAESEAAMAQVTELRLQVGAAERKAAQASAAADAAHIQAADLKESNKGLRLTAERLARVHAEQADKLRQTTEQRAKAEREHEALQQELGAAHNKLAQQEKQLRTFLDFNATMEHDLRQALAKVADLEKQCRELEFEKQTVEAYYTAKHQEMQAQFQALLHSSTGGLVGDTSNG